MESTAPGPGPVAFSDDLVLLPSRDVPQSRMRDHVLNRLSSSIEAQPRRPTAAFYRKGVIAPVFVDSGLANGSQLQPRIWFEEILDATRLLTLIPGTVPRDAGH
jgi:hypothetical protein